MSRRIVRALCVLVTLASPLHAQTTSGEISGVVTDVSGSVLPGVKVTVTNVATTGVGETTTNESGNYLVPALQPGIYTLKAERQGFRSVDAREYRGARPLPENSRGRSNSASQISGAAQGYLLEYKL
jgi:hypothetical protein